MRSQRLLPIVGLMLLLSACLPEGQRLPQSPLLSALERKSGRIAFVGLDRNVYVVDQAGAGLTAVTEDAAPSEDISVLYRTPTWSPESSRLALLRHTFEAGDVAASSIVIAGADGSERTVAFESGREHPIYLSWSPVGDRVTLLTGRATDTSYRIWSVPAAGGEAQLIEVGRPAYWAWTPGGEGLLAHIDGSAQDNPGTARISLLQLGPAVLEQRFDIEPFVFQAPSFSPAGDLALIAGYGESGASALLLTTPLGDSVAEVAPLETAAAFGWSPTGRYAAYINAEPDQPGLIGRLYVVDLADPENPMTIETDDSLVVAFDWAPNGEQILSYAPAQGPPETEGGDPTLLLQLRVTDARSGESRRLGTFRPTDDFVNILPFFDQYIQSSTAWSPDSRNIVFTAQTDDGTSAVFILAASGTVEPRGIAEGVYAVWSWR